MELEDSTVSGVRMDDEFATGNTTVHILRQWVGTMRSLSPFARSRRRVIAADLSIAGGAAADFVEWFGQQTAQSNVQAMLRACPDHFIVRTLDDGRREVLETTGGSPLAAMFIVDYDDHTSLVTAADRDYPFQIAGVARDIGGRPIGGVRHQFRDTDAGFGARLRVEFPLATLSGMVSAHRWHLACEFSNWVEALLL